MRAPTHTHAQISHTLSFFKVKGENKQMPQRRWKTGIVLIKAVKTKEGTEKHKDLKEQISTARFQDLPNFPLPPGTPIFRVMGYL